MPAERLSMRKVREVFRLKHVCGASVRTIVSTADSFWFSRSLRAGRPCTQMPNRGETWIHIHGALLVSASLLSFIPRALRVLRVLPSPDQVTIEAGPRGGSANCPSCGLRSHRIHSGYVRKLRDLPWQGRPV